MKRSDQPPENQPVIDDLSTPPALRRFDKKRVRSAFDRAASGYDSNAVLQREVTDRLLERLDVVRLEPDWILDAGCGTGYASDGLLRRFRGAKLLSLDISETMLQQLRSCGRQSAGFMRTAAAVCGDIESLPLAADSVDLVFSSLSLQWCNDVDAVFAEALRVLRPGGLYVFASFGPDTLRELRESWRQVDDGQHVNRFTDMHDLGDALMQSGYAEPVMEAEIITMTYTDVDMIMRDLKNIGANVIGHDVEAGRHQLRGLGGRDRLQRVREAYEVFRQRGSLPATYEIVYGHAWKPVAAGSDVRRVDFDPGLHR